jgi:hypothetical protein
MKTTREFNRESNVFTFPSLQIWTDRKQLFCCLMFASVWKIMGHHTSVWWAQLWFDYCAVKCSSPVSLNTQLQLPHLCSERHSFSDLNETSSWLMIFATFANRILPYTVHWEMQWIPGFTCFLCSLRINSETVFSMYKLNTVVEIWISVCRSAP